MNIKVKVAGWTRIDEALAVYAKLSPEAPCVSFEGRHWNWSEFNLLVDEVAYALSALRAHDLIGGTVNATSISIDERPRHGTTVASTSAASRRI